MLEGKSMPSNMAANTNRTALKSYYFILLYFKSYYYYFHTTINSLSKTDTFGTSTMCPSYRESNKGSKEKQGPTPGVRFTEVSVL